MKNNQTFENLASKYSKEHKHFTHIDLDVIEHIKGTKYFSVEQFENIFPNAWLQLYKLNKGVGKTYDLFRIIKDTYNRGEKFIILRWSKSELTNFKNEMNYEKQFPFYIKSNGNIYDKQKDGKHIGMLGYVKGSGLTPFRSLQFSDYSTVLLDEYVEPPNTKQDKNVGVEIVRAFVKFLLDIQRAKPKLKCYLFGNANSISDVFFDFFELDYDTKLAYDKKAGILVVNLGAGYFIGSLEKAKAMSLLKYDEQLDLFIKENRPTNSNRRLLPYSVLRKCKLIIQFVESEKLVYSIYQPIDYNQLFICFANDTLNLNYPSITNNAKSWTIDKHIQYLPSNNIWYKTFLYKIKFDKLWFVGDSSEFLFTSFLSNNATLEILV